jgi:teichuronic acid biosynthesis glycosyltransferase TuaC
MAIAQSPLRVAVVAEYYPRPSDPALGVWAHRQALAVREQGVDVRVLALERPIPPLGTVRGGPAALREWLQGARSVPRSAVLDGIPVRYVRFVSPPRPLAYQSWGRWATRPLGRALDELVAEWRPDIVHAHYAVPAGDAALRWMKRRRERLPLMVSVHGGDLSFSARRPERWRSVVRSALRGADAVIANSLLTRRGVEEVTGPLFRLDTIHLGADVPPAPTRKREEPTLVTVAHLVPHKGQAAVIRALAALGDRHPDLRYLVVGRGPAREELEQLAERLGVADRVEFLGALPHERALEEMARCHVHAMPSSHEPFGVAHIEAMAAGLVAIGGAGTGAQDIADAGEGIVLVPPGDDTALAREIDRLVGDQRERERLSEAARATVAAHFTWERNGERMAALYREVANPHRKGEQDGS